jgi:hypothetical protein
MSVVVGLTLENQPVKVAVLLGILFLAFNKLLGFKN